MNVFFDCFTKYLLYLAVCVTVLLFFRLTQNIPQHIFRKMLHYVAMTSIPFMILVSESWVPPVLIAVAVAAAAYPLLALAERWKGFSRFFAEKRKGEIKRSLLDLFLPQAVLTLIFYGWLNLPYVVVAGVLTWGVGDTFAALIGIRYGRHKVTLRFADRNKSLEGTFAGGLSSFVICLAVLLLVSPYGAGKCILMSLLTAAVWAGITFNRTVLHTRLPLVTKAALPPDLFLTSF